MVVGDDVPGRRDHDTAAGAATLVEPAAVTLDHDDVHPHQGREHLGEHPLDIVSEKPDLSPLPLGDSTKEIAPQRVAEIKRDLERRVVEDQAVRRQAARRADMSRIDRENTAALRTLVQEIGWIDAERFGREAAGHAFLIVQHSGDLRLMQAALPLIEKDMKRGIGDPQEYALLYDRLQLMQGKPQRYGSQVAVGPLGNPVVLPLEDRSKVEQFRQEIGLFPLANYLEMIEKRLPGSKVRFADDEKPEPPK